MQPFLKHYLKLKKCDKGVHFSTKTHRLLICTSRNLAKEVIREVGRNMNNSIVYCRKKLKTTRVSTERGLFMKGGTSKTGTPCS